MSAPAFAAQGLAVQLGAAQVLHGIDLQIPAGRWTCIVGPNGAGKTTLLKAIARLLPHGGRVQFMGRDHALWRQRELARQLAWLGQNEAGAEDLLARDVVMLGRLPHQPWLGAASSGDHAAVQAAMRQTQCWDWRERALGSLSGGERQRVLLARALAVQAPVLLMDEPLASLDPPHQSDWLQIVRSHVAGGGTVVSVLHELTMALHADDMVIVAAGRVVHQGACADRATHRALAEVFEGRIAVHALAGQWVALPQLQRGSA
ncbi:ABC transporter ATP-binding protein [Caenimonas terrae]|uniref:ABC transporter ATP-binding protein n=1 Tax=Caenimonas terrae TaxID=696074 RepID=A0ABW0NCJ3_9BURK